MSFLSFVARRSSGGAEPGQATVEFALVLPLLVTVMWLGVESILLVRDQTLVTHAAREGARAASVGGSTADVVRTATSRSGLIGVDGLDVATAITAGTVAVTVRMPEAHRLPLIGRLVPNLVVEAAVTMRLESEP